MHNNSTKKSIVKSVEQFFLGAPSTFDRTSLTQRVLEAKSHASIS